MAYPDEPIVTEKPDKPLPDWLSLPDPPKAKPSVIARELMHKEFEVLFERVIDEISMGETLENAIINDHRVVNYGMFYSWLKKDEERMNRYREAQEARAEAMACELIKIADATTTIEDVSRSKIRIDTRKWLIEKYYRQRYGDKVDISHGLQEGSPLATLFGALGGNVLGVVKQDVIEMGDVIEVPKEPSVFLEDDDE